MKKKYDFVSRKSVHIHLQKDTHAEFRILLLREALTMQEVLEECVERMVQNDDYMEKLLATCIHKKLTGERKIADLEAEELYKLIDEKSTDTD